MDSLCRIKFISLIEYFSNFVFRTGKPISIHLRSLLECSCELAITNMQALPKAWSFVLFFGRNMLSRQTKQERHCPFRSRFQSGMGAVNPGGRPLFLIEQRRCLRRRLYQGKGAFSPEQRYCYAKASDLRARHICRANREWEKLASGQTTTTK